VQSTGVSGAKTHRLSLTEPARNIVLRITDIRRTLVTNLPDLLTDLLELATYLYCTDALVPRGGKTMAQMGRHWRKWADTGVENCDL
jgi:hypothetical protein